MPLLWPFHCSTHSVELQMLHKELKQPETVAQREILTKNHPSMDSATPTSHTSAFHNARRDRSDVSKGSRASKNLTKTGALRSPHAFFWLAMNLWRSTNTLNLQSSPGQGAAGLRKNWPPTVTPVQDALLVVAAAVPYGV